MVSGGSSLTDVVVRAGGFDNQAITKRLAANRRSSRAVTRIDSAKHAPSLELAAMSLAYRGETIMDRAFALRDGVLETTGLPEFLQRDTSGSRTRDCFL